MTAEPAAQLPTDEDRELLRGSIRGTLEHAWPAAGAVEAAADPALVRGAWQALADLGLAALCSGPAAGGVQELLVAMEELGRAACPAAVLPAALVNLASALEHGEPAWLDAVRTGQACPAFHFAQFDGDRDAGTVQLRDGRVHGEIRYVEAADAPTHLALVVPGEASAAQLAWIDLQACAGSTATIEATPALGAPGLFRVRLAGAPATLGPLAADTVATLRAVSRLGHVARASGAAARAFELATAWACERRQFGQPIGRFQAVQHKLADIHIALSGVQLTARHAALQHDRGAPGWRLFSAAAAALAADALRTASLQTHHALGAIGYSEEHEAPRHFRRVHADVLRHGGARTAHAELAAHYLDTDGGGRLPPSDLGPAANAFRAEVEAWLAEHWTGTRQAAHERLTYQQREYDRDFARALGRTGWIGLMWPERHGGQGRGAHEQLAYIEAMERADAPRTGALVQAAMILLHGTPEQQARLLPEIRRGEAIHGMGYSEPDAGSDLASLRTRAERVHDARGSGWLINGQKIWTTTYWGEYMLLAARTDPDAKPPHAGISMFVVPMKTPGITIRTSRTMYGGTFANVFYDDVLVDDDALLGPLHGGWTVLTSALATERGFIGGGIVMKVARSFELLCAHLREALLDGRPMAQDPVVRERIGALAAQIEAGRQLMLHCAAGVQGGQTPAHDAAASKVYSGELMERYGEAALEILGMQGLLGEGSPGAVLKGRIEQQLRHALMWVISIGTNEIQRSLIAQRGLGLPR